MRVITAWCVGVLLLSGAVGCGLMEGEAVTLRFRVAPPAADGVDVPVRALLDRLPDPLADVPVDELEVRVRRVSGGSADVVGQLVESGTSEKELWWILPTCEAGVSTEWSATIRRSAGATAEDDYSWASDGRNTTWDLRFGDENLLRYMCAFDDSTPETLHETYKVFHHVFGSDRNQLTKGSGGLYTHHRGVFIGWNKLTFESKEYDFWHMTGGTQRHVEMLSLKSGPVRASMTALIHWIDTEGQTLIEERRTITAFRQGRAGARLLDFHTQLKAVAGDIDLNGDAEHAGFQFRARHDVAEAEAENKATYLFHADGIDPTKDFDLPWACMTYPLDGRQYRVQHLNHPANPSPTIYSAYRDYGRFGAFAKARIGGGETLTLRYRIVLREEELPSRTEHAAQYALFSDPLTAEVVSQK